MPGSFDSIPGGADLWTMVRPNDVILIATSGVRLAIREEERGVMVVNGKRLPLFNYQICVQSPEHALSLPRMYWFPVDGPSYHRHTSCSEDAVDAVRSFLMAIGLRTPFKVNPNASLLARRILRWALRQALSSIKDAGILKSILRILAPEIYTREKKENRLERLVELILAGVGLQDLPVGRSNPKSNTDFIGSTRPPLTADPWGKLAVQAGMAR